MYTIVVSSIAWVDGDISFICKKNSVWIVLPDIGMLLKIASNLHHLGVGGGFILQLNKKEYLPVSDKRNWNKLPSFIN